jgi:hypothetical protein
MVFVNRRVSDLHHLLPNLICHNGVHSTILLLVQSELLVERLLCELQRNFLVLHDVHAEEVRRQLLHAWLPETKELHCFLQVCHCRAFQVEIVLDKLAVPCVVHHHLSDFII